MPCISFSLTFRALTGSVPLIAALLDNAFNSSVLVAGSIVLILLKRSHVFIGAVPSACRTRLDHVFFNSNTKNSSGI